MKKSESLNICAAIIILTLIGSLSFLLNSEWNMLPKVFLYSAIIILSAVFSKKLIASALDLDAEHEIWKVSRYGLKESDRFNSEIPMGIILPLVFSAFSLGLIKFAALLTYEARALKRRAAKRFGFYSFTELSEWHNGIIGAAGITAMFIIIIVSYFLPFNLEYLSKLAAYYAFCNMIPISKLDGTQIFFGSRVLWTTLAVITLIFTAYAFII